jgi:hypothetical protein
MTEGLREVAQQLVTRRIYLLSEQADVIGIGNRPFEGRPGLLDLPGQCLRLGQPVHRRRGSGRPVHAHR